MIDTYIMIAVHLRQMDLNLLVALDALVEEGSVTRAARRVGLTQSAMSRALGRLRAHLGDPLLIRAGARMVLTPRAEGLGPALRGALQELEAIVTRGPTFDPASTRRTFRVATADYGMAVVVPALLGRLAVLAPRRRSSPGLVWTRLFTERNVCLVRRNHTSVGRTLSLEAYCALPHVVVSPEGRGSVVDEALERRGLERRVALRVPSFLVAPLVVADSDMIATTASRVARRFAEALSLRILEPPIPLPEFALALGWHERVREDPAHAWFRRLVAAVARDLA
jgi:DNA-binding transcriptional LysR family regulator